MSESKGGAANTAAKMDSEKSKDIRTSNIIAAKGNLYLALIPL
jgi:hypothetical protein